MKLIVITHSDVAIDPDVPVARWRLNDRGIQRMRGFAGSNVLNDVGAIWSSSEAKAIESAGILAARFGVGINVDAGLGENDRTATGYLPAPEFEKVADAFFRHPDESIRGWERAVDAQSRIRAAVGRIASNHRHGDLAIVAHGAVGTLLLCDCLRQPISRSADQPFQGHYWVATLPAFEVVHPWKAIDVS
jgi:broad specificity phosphatase PhoE